MTPTDRSRFARGVTASAAMSLVVYLVILWDVRLDPLRSALRSRIFSNFFDLQARAIMDGRLALPSGSLSIEGFVVRGNEYTYFPPGPALIRIPVLLFTESLDGRLTAPSMLIAWVVTAVLTGMLLWRVRVIVRGDAPVLRSEIVAASLVEASVLCGSVVLFLAALPWVYHEVYAWAIAMAVGALHTALGVLERPTPRRVMALGAFTLGAMLCRATTGWACALIALLVALAVWRAERYRPVRRLSYGLFAAGALPLAVGIAVNWAKFRAPLMFPLQNQVWTSLNPQRRAALAANGGDLVAPNIFWSTSVNYLRPDGVRVTGVFPWLTLPAEPARAYGGAFLDQTYRTASITAAVPLLTVLSVVAIVAVFRPGAEPGLRLMRIPLLGAAAILGGIMFYGYIAYRYTSEFMPVVILGSAIGVTVLSRRLAQASSRQRRAGLAILVVGTLYGITTNAAFAIHESRVANPGELLRDYVIVRTKISNVTGRPLDRMVARATTLPPSAPADQLQIIGDCQALLLATGDPLHPWATVEQRDAAFVVSHTITDPPPGTVARRPAAIDLARFTGHDDRVLRVEVLGARRYRIHVVDDGSRDTRGSDHSWTLVAPRVGGDLVSVRSLTERGSWLIDVNGIPVLEVSSTQRDDDWYTVPVLMSPIITSPTPFAGDARWTASAVNTPPVLSCTRLLAE